MWYLLSPTFYRCGNRLKKENKNSVPFSTLRLILSLTHSRRSVKGHWMKRDVTDPNTRFLSKECLITTLLLIPIPHDEREGCTSLFFFSNSHHKSTGYKYFYPFCQQDLSVLLFWKAS